MMSRRHLWQGEVTLSFTYAVQVDLNTGNRWITPTLPAPLQPAQVDPLILSVSVSLPVSVSPCLCLCQFLPLSVCLLYYIYIIGEPEG